MFTVGSWPLSGGPCRGSTHRSQTPKSRFVRVLTPTLPTRRRWMHSFFRFLFSSEGSPSPVRSTQITYFLPKMEFVVTNTKKVVKRYNTKINGTKKFSALLT